MFSPNRDSHAQNDPFKAAAAKLPASPGATPDLPLQERLWNAAKERVAHLPPPNDRDLAATALLWCAANVAVFKVEGLTMQRGHPFPLGHLLDPAPSILGRYLFPPESRIAEGLRCSPYDAYGFATDGERLYVRSPTGRWRADITDCIGKLYRDGIAYLGALATRGHEDLRHRYTLEIHVHSEAHGAGHTQVVPRRQPLGEHESRVFYGTNESWKQFFLKGKEPGGQRAAAA